MDKIHKLIKFLPTLIFAIGLFIYIPCAFVGAGWVLADLTESEGLSRDLGNLLAIFLPMYFIIYWNTWEKREKI